MRFGFSSKSIAVALAAGCLLFLSWIIVSALNEKISARNTLLINIGEISRIDEVLTNSALLATATGDEAYRVRYFDNVATLDDLISQSLALFDSDMAQQKLRNIEDANRVLVSIETRALATPSGEVNREGYARLRSGEYLESKARYSEGVAAAFVELKRMAADEIRVMKSALAALVFLSVLLCGMALRLFWQTRFESKDRKLRDRQFQKMRALIGSFMDIQNNLLNNMVYFRTKASHNLPFDSDEVDLIDAEIASAKAKLAQIAEAGIGETRDLGGIVVLKDKRSQKPSHRSSGQLRTG